VSVAQQVRDAASTRSAAVAIWTSAAVVALAALSLSLGDFPLSLEQVWRALWGGGDRVENYVVQQVRAPRTAMALAAGAALGVAGALLQAVLRNPLASPDLLGITGGSSVAAVFAVLVLGVTGPALSLAAFAGGVVVAVLLLGAGRAQNAGGYRLILAGIGVAFLSTAAINLLMVRAQVEQTQTALLWLTGSLSSTPWWQVATVVAVALVALPGIATSARAVPVSQLGEPTAAGLGVDPRRVRLVAVGTAVLLTAVVAAFVGPISFIALCAPAIARPLVGHGSIALGSSALVGAVLLVAADLVAQFAIPGIQLPVGVVTGALGAVFLLWLIAASKGRSL
jgi:iron complex transport system permease protein